MDITFKIGEGKKNEMKKIFAVLGLLSLVCFNQAYAVSADSLSPTDDVQVSIINPDTNFGYTTGLKIGSQNDSYFIFDLSSYTSGIRSAYLYLYKNSATTAASDINAYSTTTLWTEGDLTWNNKPSTSGDPITASVGTDTGWYYWNVTSLAQSVAGGDFALAMTSPTGVLNKFNSDEASTYKPYLSVTAVPEPVSTILFLTGGAVLAARKFRRK